MSPRGCARAVFLASIVLSGCGHDVERAASDSAELRPLRPEEIVGEIQYGQTVGPVAYTATPQLRAVTFRGSTDDLVKIDVTAATGVVKAFLADETFATVASATTAGRVTLEVKLRRTGTFYIAFREAALGDSSFTVRLERAPAARIVDLYMSEQTTCARSATGRVHCWEFVPDGWTVDAEEEGCREQSPKRSALGLDHEWLDYSGDYRRVCVLVGGRSRCARSVRNGFELFGFRVATATEHSNATAIAEYGPATFTLTEDGAVHMHTAEFDISPLDVGGRRFRRLRSRGGHVCGIATDGAMLCWGDNSSGQLGQPHAHDHHPFEIDESRHADLSRLTPVDVGAGRTVLDVATVGRGTCALLSDGSVPCWGLPRSPAFAERVVRVFDAAADVVCAALESGRLACWPSGSSLPDVFSAWRTGPVDFGSPVVKIVSEWRFPGGPSGPFRRACVALESGAVKCWNGVKSRADLERLPSLDVD